MDNFLILGGTGTTGRRIAQHLRSAGQPVRTASRAGSDVRLDLDDPATWPQALDGITGAYLVEPNLNGGPRLARFATAAVDAGVRRLVMLSAARAEREDHPLYAAEQAVRGSGVDWTILHPNWFAQNFSEGPWRRAILDGTLSLPTGDGRTPFIDAEDIAEVAATALTHDGHTKQVYALTGPHAVSFSEATELIAHATGRVIQYVDVDPDVYTEQQIARGVPPEAARLLTTILVSIANGWAETRTDDVEQVLGRPAGSFDEYVAKTAAEGDWNRQD